jgi:eukaryotic-like serine/threonine-protein kinase
VTPSLLLSGRYRVVTQIGQGGMSEVWQAIDEVLDRPVAIKVLGASSPAESVPSAEDPSSNGPSPGSEPPPERAVPDLDPTGVIRAEAQAAARLAHPNVASVYDFGLAEDESGRQIAYIVMELLSGQSLGERLGEGPVPAGTALRIMAEVAAALGAAHAIGLVHRDVKPGNIMLTPFGAKVFDFGIAASAGDTDRGDARGRILGTPTYVAPERLAGARVTPAADMYAFGVLLTRLFEDPEATPAEIERLRLRCLAADPASRPTAPEAQALLATRVSGLSVYSGRTISLPVPVPVAVPALAGGLPQTGYLPPPIQLTLHRPLRRPVRRWSLVATALLLAAAGLSCLAVAVEHGPRASSEATLPDPAAPTPTKPAPTGPAQPSAPSNSSSGSSASNSSGNSGFAAAVSTACETEARRRNDALARLAQIRAHGHKVTLNASIVCRNGVPVLRISR